MAAPYVKPPPNPTNLLDLGLDVSFYSDKAIGILAAEVLPYLCKLVKKKSLSTCIDFDTAEIILSFA